jgi:hypothetical protein
MDENIDEQNNFSDPKINLFEEIINEKNKLIEELRLYIQEINIKYEKELLEKDAKVKVSII